MTEPEFELDRILSTNCKEHEFGVLSNPLLNLDRPKLRELGRAFAERYGLPEDEFVRFEDAAVLAQNNEAWQHPDENLQLTEKDNDILRLETTNRWKQPRKLYSLIAVCAAAAAVQGWDQSATNGANIMYRSAFGLDNREDLYGLVTSAPLLCCFFSCLLLTGPLNRLAGRRGAIFITCLISSITCLGQSFTMTWQQMFAIRFLLGLAIGPKSATVPVFAAEAAPSSIRGALVMQWQTFTALGIFLGTLMGVIFYRVGDAGSSFLAWRLMVGSPMILPLLVCIHVYFVPESPRWYMRRGEYNKAYNSLCQLRNSRLQAARDLFYIHCLLHAERVIDTQHHRWVEMFTIPRNRRALQASFVVMFMQQFCGVNTSVHYSTETITTAGVPRQKALVFTMGFGLINFLFALPAVRIIDTVSGRRRLLLATFPLMSVFMLLTSLAFLIQHEKTKTAVVMVGIYLFAVAYSPGEGPVPFTYSAECYPLYVREIGMAIATAVTWGFNFCVTMSYPSMKRKMRPEGLFGFYAAWNLIGFFLVLLYMPQSKRFFYSMLTRAGRSLEELDRVFSVSTHQHARFGLNQVVYTIRRWVLRDSMADKPKLPVPGDTPSASSEIPMDDRRPVTAGSTGSWT
ncbi:H(+)-myo-inositol cotransporter [Sphaerosporella brunnea]|uniref:H(+)-myo-inositol cotransporter n=1 Tax=Sphaerosporella brunnea TaxID=1250544 RepID=A0A5J5EL79_9PEZI|nr:H(+)-myo-inositol cotransporter [Sphaerosporella brunnea]KAA8914483.1 H(+)-myo-inositol cotransporter [Sphaerosporella brunnea]